MITDTLHAWLVHKRVLPDATLMLTLFTREEGLLTVWMKSKQSKKQNMFQSFTPLWVVLDEKPYGLYLRKIESLAASLWLTGDALIAGFYVNEVIKHALPLQQADAHLFDVYELTLRALVGCTHRPMLERVLRRFEWEILHASGTYVSFTHEANTGLPIDSQSYYRYIAGIGFSKAEEGFLGEHLLAIEQGDLDSPEVLKSAKRIMRMAIHFALNGVYLHSRALFITS